MAAYRRVYDSRHLQSDCQGPGSAPEPYAPQSSMGHVFTLGDVVRNSGDCLDKRDRSRIIAGKKEKEDTRGFGTGT